MDKVQLEILTIAESVSHRNTYTVLLSEKSGSKRLVIVIGFYEAQAIAVSMDEEMKPGRPLTHDLLHNVCSIFNIELIEVVITELKEGVYYSVLVCKKGDFIVEIDSRTSDALALASRFKCPIYIKKEILDESGSDWWDSPDQTIEQFEEELHEELKDLQDLNISIDVPEGSTSEYKEFTIKELEEMMQSALSAEDYEKAANLRDEIARRK